MRTTAVLSEDHNGEFFTKFGINVDHLSAYGYINEIPEIWIVDITESSDQQDIGRKDDWNSTSYFAYVHNDHPVCTDKRFPESIGTTQYMMVIRNFTCYHVQFPYGWKHAERKGKTYRVDVTPIERIL